MHDTNNNMNQYGAIFATARTKKSLQTWCCTPELKHSPV